VIADSNRDLKERRERTLEQAALRRIAMLVAQGVQPEELFSIVAEEVGRVVDAPSVGVARFELDATATVCGTFPPQGPLFRTGTRVSVESTSVLGLVRDRAEPARVDGYATGAQLGLRLCRRLVERCGCVLELRPRAVRGTRAVIVAAGAES
jgi:hypothetical protein